MVVRFSGTRHLGRPFAAAVDPSVITAAIQGGAAVTTAAIPVIADAAAKGKKTKAKGKKAAKKGAAKTDKAPEKTSAPPPETNTPPPAAVPWGPILLGVGGLAVAGILLSRGSKVAASEPAALAPARPSK
jgi:hypothetical protein